MLHRRSFLGAAALAAAGPLTVHAQDPVLRIVVPFSAGSGTDLGGRVLGQAIHKTTGRTVIVDNKPGAGSVIGSLEVVRSRPDGSTLLYTTGGHTTNAALMKSAELAIKRRTNHRLQLQKLVHSKLKQKKNKQNLKETLRS